MTNSNLLSGIQGKVAVITGGSRGIGKAVAEAVIQNGGYVVIGDILEKQGHATIEELNEKYGYKRGE